MKALALACLVLSGCTLNFSMAPDGTTTASVSLDPGAAVSLVTGLMDDNDKEDRRP